VSLSQEQLRDEEEQHLVQEERYLRLVGLEGPTEVWHNTTVPVLITHARNDDHALVIAFIHDMAHLPYTILVYNLGLKPYSLAMVSNYCNSSKCAVVDFDLELFPSHVSDESITAFRPLIIQISCEIVKQNETYASNRNLILLFADKYAIILREPIVSMSQQAPARLIDNKKPDKRQPSHTDDIIILLALNNF
ncbi:jg21640, partial [Pararge aegeria aegeria]